MTETNVNMDDAPSQWTAARGIGLIALRLLVTVGGAVLAVRFFNVGFSGLPVFVAAGMVVFGVGTALSIYFGAWRRAVRPVAEVG